MKKKRVLMVGGTILSAAALVGIGVLIGKKIYDRDFQDITDNLAKAYQDGIEEGSRIEINDICDEIRNHGWVQVTDVIGNDCMVIKEGRI